MKRLNKCCTTAIGVTSTEVLYFGKRYQSQLGTQNRLSRAFDNPLAGKDPAKRSVMVPDTFHVQLKENQPQGAEELRKRALRVMAKRQAEEVLWPGTTLTNTDTPLIQMLIKARTNPQFRNSKKVVVLGGRKMMEEMARSRVYPETLLLPAGAEIPNWAKKSGCEIIPVTKEVAEAVDPGGDGYVGNFKMPDPPEYDELIANNKRLERVLVLDNVTDPGNLGTLLRTASAFAYDAIILTNHCADLYHHAVLRAARGVHFLKNVRIFVLREEDGDDTYAMINHVINRNQLETVAYTPLPFEESSNRLQNPNIYAYPEAPGALLPRTLFNTKPKAMPTSAKGSELGVPLYTNASAVHSALPSKPTSSTASSPLPPPPSTGPPSSSNAATAKKLFNFMVDNFVSTAAKPNERNEAPPHFAEKGFMLFAGPDAKRNLVRKLEQRVSKPTTVLQLDESQDSLGTDLMTALPSVMYALRPAGQWDYLLPTEKHDASVTSARNANVQIGPDVLNVSPPNLDEYDQTVKALEQHHWRVNRRQIRRMRTDEGYWLQAENTNAHKRGKAAIRNMRDPMRKFMSEGLREKMADEMPLHGELPPNIPNITTDYMENVTRDSLRHERDAAEQMDNSAPSLYDHKMFYENSRGVRRSPR